LLYLPSLGFTCAAAYGLTRQRRAAWAAAALALAYGGRTVARNADWHDHVTLFSSAARVSPRSGLVQANLANGLLYRRGDAAGAARHALEAIRIEPGDPAAYMTLADALVKLRDLDQAARAYRRVEELAAGSAGAAEAARRREAIERRRR
jgi:Flp pilus assembly protein TadD